jgi:hypothetical protein
MTPQEISQYTMVNAAYLKTILEAQIAILARLENREGEEVAQQMNNILEENLRAAERIYNDIKT